MASSLKHRRDGKIVVDQIHGDIHLEEDEWAVIDTASYQRLRQLKQLQMAHLTYPNATHTRFAHSLGVFAITCRILDAIKRFGGNINETESRRLRFAALLHDVGHYPYSHLMEGIDFVKLTDEVFDDRRGTKRVIDINQRGYPDHETIGERVVCSRSDIYKVLGGIPEAREISSLFRGTGEQAQLTKLIHSSLDVDRLDYLQRDAISTGTPYGQIDLDYILNNVRLSPNGELGVTLKALPAAEHFLLARLYMHRVVYWHKTTYGFEEACRQLLRRLRQDKNFEAGIPRNGDEVDELVSSERFLTFSDSLVDRAIDKAYREHADPVIKALAQCIILRKAPKLLREIVHFNENPADASKSFWVECKHSLASISRKYRIPLGQFLFCQNKPFKLEERGSLITRADAEKLVGEEKREQLIRVIERQGDEPKSLVDINYSPIHTLAQKRLQITRLYVVCANDSQLKKVDNIRSEISGWG